MSEEYKGKSIVESGASIAGGVTGALIGAAIVGSPGAVIGAIVGPVVQKGIVEFANRFLSSREKFRVESTAHYTILKIKQLRDIGYVPRDDDFFQIDETDRSKADELFEGVLLKAKNEPQEKKIRFLGNLFANVAFRSDVSSTVANAFLSTAEALSYRQLCLIALIQQEGIVNFKSLRNRDHLIPDLEILKKEEWDLHPPNFGTFGLVDGSDWDDWLSDLGDMFCDLLCLDQIPQEDIAQLSRLISMCEASPPPRGPTERKTPPDSKRNKMSSNAQSSDSLGTES